MKNCLMGNGSIEINLGIVCHSLPLTTKIKRVVNIKENGHHELSPQATHRTFREGPWLSFKRFAGLCVGIGNSFL